MAQAIEVGSAAPIRNTMVTAAVRKRRRDQVIVPNLWRVGIVVVIFGLWQLGATAGVVNTFLFSSPELIWTSAARSVQDGSLATDLTATLTATLVGFALGTVLGVGLGLTLWFFPRVQRVLDPFFVVFNALPKIALGPMLVIWLGSGLFSKVMLATFATFVVAALNAYQGARKADEQMVGLLRSMGATKLQTFHKLVLPTSLPWVVAAFKINIGLALVAVIGGEFVSANAGLGYKAAVSGSLFDIAGVWVAIFTIMIVATVLYFAVSAAERKLIRRSA